MFKCLTNQNLGKLYISFIILFLLSGCEKHHCIKPENLSGLREKLDIVSTEQKWVDSNVYISDKIKITEINIIPNKVSFCTQYKDFVIQPGKNFVKLPFTLKKGDKLTFSIIGNKVCEDREDDTKTRYISIDKKCSKKEEEYFRKISNQENCQDEICPNKYILGNSKWLNGKEYWSSDFSKLDQNAMKEEIENIINFIKQENKIDCKKLLSNQKIKIDTYLLNLACENTCYYANQDCVQIESNTIDNIKLNVTKKLANEIVVKEVSKEEAIKKAVDDINKKKINTYIPSLKVSIGGEENLKYIRSDGIYTNYNYKIKKDYNKDTELVFTLKNSKEKNAGKGGYNIRLTKSDSLTKNLYIYVSDKFPEHNPGEIFDDIPVDISKVHNTEYMESLKKKLKNKTGTIFYGIKDHDCDYKENKGQFSINLTTKEPSVRTFSAIYNFFNKKVKAVLSFGSNYKDINIIYSDNSPVNTLYQSFIASNKTKTIRSTIVSLLILYIILYTIYYFLGLSHISIYELLIISVKIGIISQLLRDNSWSFFYNNAFSIFIDTPEQLIEIANFRGTTLNVFEFLDLPLNRFLSTHSILLTVSLMFSGPLGIISFCLIIWGMITVILSIFNALFSFITSITIVALLLFLAPIFIIFLLFVYTRQMFYSWIKNLARFTIHPVVLLIFISLISQIMDYIVHSVFDFEVCSTCILNLNLRIFNHCILYGYTSKYTPNIIAMMAFVVLGHTMKALVEASSMISDSLFSVYVACEPGRQYQQNLMGIVGLNEQSIQRRVNHQSSISTKIPHSTQRLIPKIPIDPWKQ